MRFVHCREAGDERDDAPDRPHEPAEEHALVAVPREEGLALLKVGGVEPPATGAEEVLAPHAEVVAHAIAEDGASGGEPDQVAHLEDAVCRSGPSEDDQRSPRHEDAGNGNRLRGGEEENDPVAPHPQVLEGRQKETQVVHWAILCCAGVIFPRSAV